MASRLATCPETDLLENFLLGELPDAELEAIAEHLDGCAACRHRVESKPELAALADDLRHAARKHNETRIETGLPLARLNELLTDYEVIAEIGRGGMGIVYQARQQKLNRVVALKVLPALLGAVRPDAVQRFRREAELAARLAHSNIIGVHDFGEVDGTFYYTMQLVEGRSLRYILQEISESGATDVVIGGPNGSRATKTLSKPGSSSTQANRAYYERVANWMAEIAEALEHAHGMGVIHRDIKPSNLLLGADGRMMITDFGLARACEHPSVTASRTLIGTARYMSPEQVDSTLGGIDARADIYGLGATMYELLAFRPMFSATDDREVLHHVLQVEPSPPRRFVKQVPRELETICLKALEKDRTARYAGAKDLADDLRRWLLGMPILARRPGALVRAGKFVKRRKLATALTTACAVLLVGSCALYANYLSERRVAAERQIDLAIESARGALDRWNLPEALDAINDGLKLAPDSTQLLELRARALISARKNAQAFDTVNHLLARHPDNAYGHYLAAMLVADRSALVLGATFPLSTTVERLKLPPDERRRLFAFHCERLAMIAPQSNDLNVIEALRTNDPKQSIVSLSRCLEREPARRDALQLRAEAYDMVRDYSGMLLDAERMIVLLPDVANAHSLRGRALTRLGRHEEAEKAESMAITKEPSDPMYWCNRAVSKNALGKYSLALADTNEAIRLDQNFTMAYATRAAAHSGLGKHKQALDDLSHALTLKPGEVILFLERGRIHMVTGEFEDAVADATRAMEIAPKDPRCYELRARAFIELNRCDRALADLSEQVNLESVRPFVYRNRAAAFRKCGHLEEAIDDLSMAIKLDGGIPGDFVTRAMLFMQQGKRVHAIADLSKLIDDENMANSVRIRRGALFELAGDRHAALADYDVAGQDQGPIGKYAKLWKYLLLRLSHDDANAEPVLTLAKKEPQRESWTDRLQLLFRGEITPDELLAAAATKSETAEANYFIGMKALLDGRSEEAKQAFEASVALKQFGAFESDFAQARLAGLNEHLSTGSPLPPPAEHADRR